MRHAEHKDRQRQDRADPEPTGHVAQLGILFFVARNLSFRLKRHAADWAIARMILFDLRMHWTRVDHLIGQPCLPDWTRESPESVNSFEDCKNHQLRASGDIIGAASEHR